MTNEAPTSEDQRTRQIGIIGAGLSGTLVASSLVRASHDPLMIDLIDESGRFGPGCAYSTRDEQHVLNVPAARASVRADDPTHFVAYAQTIDADVGPGSYVPRSWYGAYLERELEHACAAAREHAGRIELVHARAVSVRAGIAAERGRVERVELVAPDAGVLSARTYDAVVVALGNLPGAALIAIPEDPRAFASPWSDGALDVSMLRPGERFDVLVVGTALTAVDAILSLTEAHESVRVTAVSRSGRLPYEQIAGSLRAPAPAPHWPSLPDDLDELVERVHDHFRVQQAAGFDWRDAVDGLRPIIPDLWRTLPVDEQARFVRERSRDWELRRHRMAPQVRRRIDQLIYDERLVVLGGGVHDIVIDDGQLAATLDRPGRPSARLPFDRVIDCTGAATDITRATSDLVAQLLRDGRAEPDAHRRGLRTDGTGALLDARGIASPQLFTLGTLRRGELWETTGIAEIRDQAAALAARMLDE